MNEPKICRLCGGNAFLPVIDFGEAPLVNSLLTKEECGTEKTYPLLVEQCQKCFLVQIVNPVDSRKIYQDQDYLYYTGDMPQNSQYMRAFNSLVDDIQNNYTKAGDLIVEIGSNDGTILRRFTNRRVLGIDPAINVVVRALMRGVPTLSTGFDKQSARNIAEEYGLAQVIGGANCLAHIDNIHGVLEGVEALLDTYGVFWAECNYWGGMVSSKHYALIYHDHYSYYTLKNWVDLLNRHNMYIFDAMITEAQGEGLSLRLYASKDARRTKTQRFQDLLHKEEVSNLNSHETAKKYREDVIMEAEKLGTLVKKLAAEGKIIAGYGAAAKGFSILHLAKITGEHIKFFVDDSPAKQGKYTPVTHIPVFARKDIQNPDYFFLTAPNYKDIILEKETAYRNTSGKFITSDSEIIS
ncbi:MAG: hypothetical protein A3J54_02240 [Candidatus Ryanbacteria bacterium RIFCSPHIGHO2_02_FULL_45_13b]|uniref:Methyltransferase n=1 Tax=Candidatus Ryanbacteria bacterium RIFCSPHIGHO2_02_FULL_45_13b TaxID=1802117 RepID=A0A1G2GB77_9BACT|nr:MAG: hypothetical protein A3J54_02240 [Candidatus Ryanbacteria bacterium RIFCSPHIGHO2_02_FULL_45_13b]